MRGLDIMLMLIALFADLLQFSLYGCKIYVHVLYLVVSKCVISRNCRNDDRILHAQNTA